MLGKVKDTGFDEWSYGKTRLYLLANSAGFKIAINKIKEKHSLHGKWKKTLDKIVSSSSFGIVEQISIDIFKLAEFTDVDPGYVFRCITNDAIESITAYSSPVFTSGGYEPLPSGFYIKVSSDTRWEAIVKAFKEIRAEQTKLNKSQDGKKLRINLESKKQKGVNQYVEIFMQIEKILYQSQTNEDRDNGYSGPDGENDSNMDEIFEEVACKIYKKWERKEKQKIKEIYYKRVMSFYKLPRLKQYEELLFKSIS